MKMILQEQWEAALQAISSGMTKKDAIALSGISEAAFYARQKEDVEFLELVKKAEISFKLRHLHNIEKHSQDNWSASAWLLERKFKQEFGKEHKVEHSFNPIKEINITDNGRIESSSNGSISEE